MLTSSGNGKYKNITTHLESNHTTNYITGILNMSQYWMQSQFELLGSLYSLKLRRSVSIFCAIRVCRQRVAWFSQRSTLMSMCYVLRLAEAWTTLLTYAPCINGVPSWNIFSISLHTSMQEISYSHCCDAVLARCFTFLHTRLCSSTYKTFTTGILFCFYSK